MIIKDIKLTNFRNHKNYNLECKPNITLILGSNGFGKTSILEAIYILTRGKSFRATDPEILNRGSNFYRIELEYNSGEKIFATYDGNQKVFHIEDKKTKRLPKNYKQPIVLFLPSDLNLISHSPGRRRDYFDQIISQINESHSSNLSKYEKALRQRNELLKKEHHTKEDLFSWNILLSEYGIQILRERFKCVEEFNQRITNVYQSIAENQDEIHIYYKTDLNSFKQEDYLKQLEQNFEKDSYLGHTSFGIHRDDYVFDFNQKVANGSASRGETRSIILALKFIEANQIYQKTHIYPIILLDDVFSELDPVRRKALTKNFKDNQIIITSVEDVEV